MPERLVNIDGFNLQDNNNFHVVEQFQSSSSDSDEFDREDGNGTKVREGLPESDNESDIPDEEPVAKQNNVSSIEQMSQMFLSRGLFK